jgi:hypothetical protein
MKNLKKYKDFIGECESFKHLEKIFEEDDSWISRHHCIISGLHGETSKGYKSLGDQISLIGGPGGEDIHIYGWENARDESPKLVEVLKKNKTGKIVCFSKGCEYLNNIEKHLSNKSNLWIIEPYGKIKIPEGVPKNQIILGPTPERGSENFEEGNVKTPEGTDHWGSLEYTGKLMGIYREKDESEILEVYQKYGEKPVKPTIWGIQQFLKEMGTRIVDGKGGSSPLIPDGKFGEDTASALAVYFYGTESLVGSSDKNPQKISVSELQKKLGVKETGKVDEETLSAISKKINEIVRLKLEKAEKDAGGFWNSEGTSARYGETIKNVMNGNTAPYEKTFQSRQTFYRQIHELLYSKPNAEAKDAIESFSLKPIHSNWFQAASSVNQANALGAADNFNLWIISDETEEMLRYCGIELLKRNIVTAKEMLLGTLDKSFTNAKGQTIKLDKSFEGQKLDNRLVEYEQSELNKIMADYKKKTETEDWNSMIDGINASFGLPAAPSMISNVIKKFFGPKVSATAGILDVFLSSTSPLYSSAKKIISGVSNYFDHTFNIDDYENRSTLGKGCVAQIYHGDGNTSGMNLI